MIALIDYGAGNVRSVHKALVTVGAQVEVTRDPSIVIRADKVVLPGVGAFADCINSLERLTLTAAIAELVARETPMLAICVGMQVLFDEGEELGLHPGLKLLPGRVVRFTPTPERKVPHTGWNLIRPLRPDPLLEGLPPESWTYFNHSYYCQAHPDHTLAITDYGGDFPCVVRKQSLYGIQFHPEKSQHIGLQILRNFVERVR